MKKKRQGHYCHVCGEHKANEKFSGKGHAAHICKACSALPLERRNELQRINRIVGIDLKSFFHIPKDKIGLLRKYVNDKRYPEAALYAKDILERFDGRNKPQDEDEEYWDDSLPEADDSYIPLYDRDIDECP
ncbi:MAG: hypothetical protein LBJ58_06795 [Tannerellaceae bacterium]|jgi:hypothetical protein|nr:hypothetical protein [Tannerellaceae bacterium]